MHVSNNAGEPWTLVVSHENSDGWETNEFNPADFVELTDKFQVRFAAHDVPRDSRVEAAIDAVLVTAILCGCARDPEWLCDGDVDGDGQVNPVDSGLVQAAFGSTNETDLCQYDVDCDGQINPVDSGIVQSLFGTCEAPREVCP